MTLFKWNYVEPSIMGDSREYAYPILLVNVEGEPGVIYFEPTQPYTSPFVRMNSMSLKDFNNYFEKVFDKEPIYQEKHDMIIVLFEKLQRYMK